MRRTNKQFTEEVFRRSEEQLQKLKQKKKKFQLMGKFLAACLAFCIALGTVPYVWNNSGTDSNDNSGIQNGINGTDENGGNQESNGDDESFGNLLWSGDNNGFLLEVQAADLMEGFTGEHVNIEIENTNATFKNAQMNLAVKLFQQSVAETPEKNTLISPIFISMVLAMTANGAERATKAEMEQLLAEGRKIEDLNQWFYSYLTRLPSAPKYKCSIANSIWFRDDEGFTVEKDFLQTNANYYHASAYQSPFDQTTVTDINKWVSFHTDEMIPQIIDQIDGNSMMYLLNAVCFDAEWADIFRDDDVKEAVFTTEEGQERMVEMMYSLESTYLENDSVTGFAKNYQSGKYSFVALLPKESVSLTEYVNQLTGEELQNLLENKKDASVEIALPKFSYEYELSMESILNRLGMTTAFDEEKADFTGISSNGNLYIGDVRHKTFIEVGNMGTRAAAVTGVEMDCLSGVVGIGGYKVELNRPFVYMIVDNETNLPIFIGSVTDISK